jgi:hypothetical protein
LRCSCQDVFDRYSFATIPRPDSALCACSETVADMPLPHDYRRGEELCKPYSIGRNRYRSVTYDQLLANSTNNRSQTTSVCGCFRVSEPRLPGTYTLQTVLFRFQESDLLFRLITATSFITLINCSAVSLHASVLIYELWKRQTKILNE